MKFKCESDNTKKFTPGKVYETPASHAKHNVILTDDTGRTRIFSVTHGGKGIRWNCGGKRHTTMMKLEPTFKIDKTGTIHITDGEVTRIKIGVWGDDVNKRQGKRFKKAVCAAICAVAVGLVAGAIYTLI